MALRSLADVTDRPKRILLCDDERHQVRLIQTWLEQRGHTAVPSYDGQDAIKLLSEGEFDLLILDIMMPSMDGFEVLKSVRTEPRLKDLRVIMLTAKSQDEDVIAAYQFGADLYLIKPIKPSDLIPFVDRL